MLVMFPPTVTFIGLIVEVVGVVMMARQFANVPFIQLPAVLISALISKKAARNLIAISEMSGDKPMEFVQGLGCVCLGIMVQVAGATVELALKAQAH